MRMDVLCLFTGRERYETVYHNFLLLCTRSHKKQKKNCMPDASVPFYVFILYLSSFPFLFVLTEFDFLFTY